MRYLRLFFDRAIDALGIITLPLCYVFSLMDPKEMIHGPHGDRTRWEYVKSMADFGKKEDDYDA